MATLYKENASWRIAFYAESGKRFKINTGTGDKTAGREIKRYVESLIGLQRARL